MKKFINAPAEIVREELEGFALAYPHYVHLTPEGLLVRRRPKEPGKVGLVIGHGVGHEPSFCGWVGRGLYDVDVPGEIFTCADPVKILAGIRAANRGAGVLLTIANHPGDVLNGEMAVELARAEGLEVRPVLLGDDVASAPKGREHERRGIAGIFFAVKAAGAAAERGWPLDEMERVAVKANRETRTLGVALSPPTHPVTGRELFSVPEGGMEIGMGVHGEAGVYRGKLLSADETARLVLGQLLEDRPYTAGDRVLVLFNGAGATTLMELHILNRTIHRLLAERGITVADTLLGEFVTTQEMKGFSLSLCAVDDELLDLWSDPADAPYFVRVRRAAEEG